MCIFDSESESNWSFLSLKCQLLDFESSFNKELLKHKLAIMSYLISIIQVITYSSKVFVLNLII
jgi:hypothetical protein